MENLRTLTELFQEITKYDYRWDYYKRKSEEMVRVSFPLTVNCSSYKEFIKAYMKKAGKFSYLIDEQLFAANDETRIKHIISTYFLGVVLFKYGPKVLRSNIRKQLKKLPELSWDGNKHNFNRKFLFVWFLITLYHDLGYKYEGGISEEKDEKEFYTIDSVIPSLMSNFERPETVMPSELFVPPFLLNVAPAYYSYRKNQGKLDHGIVQGALLHRELIKTMLTNSGTNDELYYFNPNVFFNISSIIYVHNIWFRTEGKDDCDEYRDCHLDNLIYEADHSNYRIKLSEYPLLFLFQLIDTIEPLKKGISSDCISFDFSPSIIENNKLKIVTDNISIKTKIQELKDWLINVSENGNEFTIDLS